MLSIMPQIAHLPLHVQQEPPKDVELNEVRTDQQYLTR